MSITSISWVRGNGKYDPVTNISVSSSVCAHMCVCFCLSVLDTHTCVFLCFLCWTHTCVFRVVFRSEELSHGLHYLDVSKVTRLLRFRRRGNLIQHATQSNVNWWSASSNMKGEQTTNGSSRNNVYEWEHWHYKVEAKETDKEVLRILWRKVEVKAGN